MLSFCIIAKDEEEQLPRCLESIKELADEVVLCVDDRTTDKTAEIGSEFDAQVHPYTWTDNFSAARNESFEYASGDWIGVIDADEELAADSVPILKEIMATTDKHFIIMNILNKHSTSSARMVSRRFFRKGKGCYEDRAHNQLKAEGEGEYVNAWINHYGYELSPEKMKEKQERTERLLKIQVEEGENVIFAQQNLVRCYRAQGKWAQLIDVAGDVLDEDIRYSRPYTYQMVLYDMAFAFAKLKRYGVSRCTCETLLEANRKNIDGLFLKASIHAIRREYREAVDGYFAYLTYLRKAKQDPPLNGLIIETWDSEDVAWRNIERAQKRLDGIKRRKQKQVDGTLDILFVQEIPSKRCLEIAKELTRLGHHVTLAHTRENADWMFESIFDEAVQIRAFQDVWSILLEFDLVHCFGPPDILTVAMLNNGLLVVHDCCKIATNEGDQMVEFSEGIANHNADARVYATDADLDKAKMLYGIDESSSIAFRLDDDISGLETFYRQMLERAVRRESEEIPIRKLAPER